MRISFGQLRWLTIVAPVVFLGVSAYIAHFVFPDVADNPAVFGLALSASALAVFLFSHVVFGIIERLEQQVHRQNWELSALSAVSTALSQPRSMEESVQVALDTVLEALGASADVVCVLDEENEELFSTAHRGLSPDLVDQVRRSKLADDPVGEQVVREGRPVVLRNAFEDPRVKDVAIREGFRSIVSAPLKSQGKVVGVMGLCSDREGAFDDSRVRLLERIAGQVGIAVEKAELFEELTHRNRDLAILNDVSKALSSSLDLDEVMEIALDKVLEASGGEVAEMWLVDPDSSPSGPKARRGISAEALEWAAGTELGQRECCQVVQKGKEIFPRDGACPQVTHGRSAGTNDVRILGCLPLKSGTELVGILCVLGREFHSLADRQRQMLQSVAGQIGVAIKNAQLYEQVQDLAILEERDRIAREMHDGLAQVLGYVNTKAFAVRKLLAKGQVSAAGEYLSQLEEAAREVYADVREGVLGLRSTVRSDETLLAGLADYIAKFNRLSGIQAECQADNEVSQLRLPVTAEIQVIRIVQEALSNVRKRARAKEARVKLTTEDGHLTVAIEDGGCGFDVAVAARGEWPRFGLQTMRERAEAVGGTFQIESEPGSGTKVTVTIPLAEDQEVSRVP